MKQFFSPFKKSLLFVILRRGVTVAGVSKGFENWICMKIDWKRLWKHVIQEFQCNPDSIHGPSHWQRVERNGLLLAKRTGCIEEVVRLFALFHDSRREHDGWDITHGKLGADYAKSLRGVLFDISDDHFELLHYACTWHTHGSLIKNLTIGTCWDADRLDLGRVGIKPNASFMSTKFARKIAENGMNPAIFCQTPKHKNTVGKYLAHSSNRRKSNKPNNKKYS